MRKNKRENDNTNYSIIARIVTMIVSERLNLKKDEVLSPSRRVPLPYARDIIAYLLITKWGLTHEVVARFLHRERSSATAAISRLKNIIDLDGGRTNTLLNDVYTTVANLI